MTSTVAFNGFNLTGTSPRGGVFSVLGLDGWLTVSLRRNRQEKAQQGGAWESTGFPNSLPITVHGKAVYASAAAAALERRELIAVASSSSVEMTVTDAGGTGTRFVEADSIVVSPVMDRMFTFAIVATACDPLLYGAGNFQSATLSAISGGTGLAFPMAFPLSFGVAPGVTPGALLLPNAGTASYFPRLRIDGPVPNPRITLAETGDTITLNYTIAAGQWVDINAGKPREVLLNGRVSLRHKTSAVGNWCAIPVGGGSLSWTADAADPAATLSAWGYEGAWS